MKTSIDCLPCLLKQALFTGRLATSCKEKQKAIMAEALNLLRTIDYQRSPPENAVSLYRTIKNIAGNEDPYLDLKQQSNQQALALRDRVQGIICRQTDPLLSALRFAAAGNIIDYGSHHQFDLDKTLAACQDAPFAVDDYQILRKDLAKAQSVLYLADNCGEIVFDSFFIEKMNKKTHLAVKEGPVINDAVVADAVTCGLDQLCTVLSNGTDCPGTPLDQCTPEFVDLFNSADLIISKGQGNFETLSECRRPVYFLLTVKCPVVADHLHEKLGEENVDIQQGDMVLIKNSEHW